MSKYRGITHARGFNKLTYWLWRKLKCNRVDVHLFDEVQTAGTQMVESWLRVEQVQDILERFIVPIHHMKLCLNLSKKTVNQLLTLRHLKNVRKGVLNE